MPSGGASPTSARAYIAASGCHHLEANAAVGAGDEDCRHAGGESEGFTLSTRLSLVVRLARSDSRPQRSLRSLAVGDDRPISKDAGTVPAHFDLGFIGQLSKLTFRPTVDVQLGYVAKISEIVLDYATRAPVLL